METKRLEMPGTVSHNLVPWIAKTVIVVVLAMFLLALPALALILLVASQWKRFSAWFTQEAILTVPKTDDELLLEALKNAQKGQT